MFLSGTSFRRRVVASLLGLLMLAAGCGDSGPWTPTPTGGPSPRGESSFACNDEIGFFIWGGALPPSGVGRRVFSDGAILRSEGWSEIPDGPMAARGNAGAIAIDNRIFVWGGSGSAVAATDPEDFDFPTDGGIYDVDTQSWKPVPAAPLHGRPNPELAGARAEVLIYGPPAPQSPAWQKPAAAIFDIDRMEWRNVKPPPAGAFVVGLNDGFVAFGDGLMLRYSDPDDDWQPAGIVGVASIGTLTAAFPSRNGGVLLFQTDATLEYNPASDEVAVIGDGLRHVPTTVMETPDGVIVWADGTFDSSGAVFFLPTESGEWTELEPPLPHADRHGTASCFSMGRLTIWGGISTTSDHVSIARSSGATALVSELIADTH